MPDHPLKDKQTDYDSAIDEFSSGEITQSRVSVLTRYLSALGSNLSIDDRIRNRDQIQAMTISHLLLQNYIADIERRSKVWTYVVAVLALASLIASIVQILLALH